MAGRPTQRPWVDNTNKTHWYDVTPTELPYFSAVCWYTGKALYERTGSTVPIGLIMGANGGTAIEMFMPKASVAGAIVTPDVHASKQTYSAASKQASKPASQQASKQASSQQQ
jgi:hypothetical protein